MSSIEQQMIEPFLAKMRAAIREGQEVTIKESIGLIHGEKDGFKTSKSDGSRTLTITINPPK
jgi:hypothetical protein